ncbi:type III toxin-antitoxin system ToxN/AbiQ family toxin [Arsenophonus endosymbiont of Aleurodicus floccissimus]|uniref:type III toxin-antitoxin system ToxN/AbiQ family toxin n=1 Tax=Arsenophonus endosymbiont of Aleurodicus floccissimus TaxID=2152761 RepID=UPI000E6B40AD|nr:type III toxin-antitoxin system ToxN/AbiQ family toxin [Arsenophonus endosymbiont of Aleurodicus floccissimus]
MKYLKNCDGKVRENKGGPYIGVVLEVNGVEFLAPLTSYKSKQDSIPDASPLIFKMHELGNEENKLVMVQLNNMVPVLSSEKTLLDLSAQAPKYQNLLNLQQQYLRKNKEKLQKRANKLYKIVSKGYAIGLISKCCNFGTLEAAMKNYSSQVNQSVSQDKLVTLTKMFAKN